MHNYSIFYKICINKNKMYKNSRLLKNSWYHYKEKRKDTAGGKI